MHRPTVGIVALLLLAASLGIYVWQPDEETYAAWMSAFLRVGLVMGALWLAHPQLAKLPRWFLAAALGVVVVGLLIARNARLLVIALVVLVVVARLRPRS
jgi:hypothetical protein